MADGYKDTLKRFEEELESLLRESPIRVVVTYAFDQGWEAGFEAGYDKGVASEGYRQDSR